MTLDNLTGEHTEGDPDSALRWAEHGDPRPLLRHLRGGYPVTQEMADYLADSIDPNVLGQRGRPKPWHEILRDKDIAISYDNMGGKVVERLNRLADEYGLSPDRVKKIVAREKHEHEQAIAEIERKLNEGREFGE